MKKKKRICMAFAAALSMSLAISATALAAIPSDIGGHWAQGTIIQWTSNRYIAGYPDGTFKPDNSITRAEFVVLVNKAMGYNDRGNAYFSDVSASHWAYAEIMKGVEAGYITGNGDGTFRPDAPVTRQEAAVMISKILGLGQDFASAAKYADYRYIPSWAAGYVGAVTNAGIMSGYPDRDFKADRVLTRAEAVISLDKTMNYDNKTEEDDREVFEDYRLTSTSLSDKIIKGDLIISSTLSSRDVSLDNVKVEGKLIVDGGKTITADDCEINELEMSKNDAEFVAEGKTTVKETTFEKYGKLVGSGYSKVIIDNEFNSYIELDAEIDYVELDAETNVRLLSDCVIETFEATSNADNATVNFSSAEVEDMDIYDAIRITGKGDIKNMTVYKSGVKSSIKPDDLNTRNGASKPDYTSTSSGDIGYNSGSRYDDLTASRDRTYSGGRYDDVKVTADGRVKLKNMTIYGNLTIDEDVENGDVYLEDLDIRGNVYIYGGGKNTVSFKDCEIEGDIYASKDYDNTPVGIDIDSSTAKDLDGYIYIDDDGAILEAGGKLDNVYVLTESKVEIDTDVKNLYVREKTSNLTITAGTTVDKLSISSSSAKNSTIKLDGNVKEISTNYDITVTGSGDYDKRTGSGTVTKDDDQKISVTGVTLETTATVEAGNTYQLIATVQPTNATNKKVTWSSDKTDIATVNENGLVTAKAAGTANITVTTEDGSKTATCAVTVTAKEEETVAVTGVSISDGNNTEQSTLQLNGTLTLRAVVDPENASNKNITWSVTDNKDDADVVTLNSTTDENITVIANAVGEATITVTTADGSHTDTYKVIVEAQNVEVTGVELEQTSLTLEEGATATLTAKVTPEDATDKTVTWTSSDESVATVDENGEVTAVKASETPVTITATAGEETATCTVTVTARTVAVQSVTITGSGVENKKATMTAGGTLQLTAEVEPTEATNKEVDWRITSAHNEAVTLNPNGNTATVTAVIAGTATITATAKDGSSASDSITVTVNPKVVESISLNPTTTTLTSIGQTAEITATVNPSDAVYGTVTWESSAPEYVSVTPSETENGKATIRANGATTEGQPVTITATAGGQTATCTVTVTVPVTGVSITSPENKTTLNVDEKLQLTAKVTLPNATNNTVTWSSNDVSVAEVSGTGLVIAKSAGTAIITAKVDDNHSAKFTITVKAAGSENGNHPGTGADNGNGDQTETGGVTGNGNQTGGNDYTGNEQRHSSFKVNKE